MKKLQVFTGAAMMLILAACQPASPPVSPTAHQNQVARSATFDHDCPVERIEVVSLDQMEQGEPTRFAVLVCGDERTYRRIGSMYYDEELAGEVDI